jgi:hypothetical protein
MAWDYDNDDCTQNDITLPGCKYVTSPPLSGTGGYALYCPQQEPYHWGGYYSWTETTSGGYSLWENLVNEAGNLSKVTIILSIGSVGQLRSRRGVHLSILMATVRGRVPWGGVGAVGKWPVAATATSLAAAGHLSTAVVIADLR